MLGNLGQEGGLQGLPASLRLVKPVVRRPPTAAGQNPEQEGLSLPKKRLTKYKEEGRYGKPLADLSLCLVDLTCVTCFYLNQSL